VNTKTANIDLAALKSSGKIFKENAGASIIDTGDRIALVEFHTKANSLNDDVCEMLIAACEEGVSQFDAIVIGNSGKHFSAGANLPKILSAARENKWKELELMISNLQRANMTLKYGALPVVSAPFSSTLGGGCEVCLHSDRVVVSSQTHMGLVETGVGLIPAGGGTKELGLRAQNRADGEVHEVLAELKKAFDLIVQAKISDDGNQARELFLRQEDIVMPPPGASLDIAKNVALELVSSGFQKSKPRTDIRIIGKRGLRVLEEMMIELEAAKAITTHDQIIALHVAEVLCGGDRDEGTESEQYFLDLEREAFLSLLGTPKTQERIEYLLKENKRLSN
jgi:3-hydroxyacyl-CoA dehydrogenase